MTRYWPRLPLAGKVFLVCVSMAFVVSLVGSIVLYQGACDSLRQQTREHLKALAATAALQIDPVIHETIRKRGDESSANYKCMKKILAAMRAPNSGVRHVYTMRKTDRPEVWQFVVDGEQNPELVSHVGDDCDVRSYPDMQLAFSGPAADQDLTEDEWGIWLSGYAPIRDASGRAVAVIGMDMSQAHLLRERAMLWQATVRNVLVALAMAMFLSLLVTRALLRPVRVFTRAAERVRGGDLEFQVPVTGSDEICRFAQAFNHMIAGLRQTTRDVLTGAFNHMYFHEMLTAEIERGRRYKHRFCLLILDLDRFKVINDSMGHPIGDSIIRQLAQVLQEGVRKSDHVFRYGGDEFAVVLPETDKEAGMAVAEGLREQVEKHCFSAVPVSHLIAGDSVEDERRVVHLSITVGLSAFPVDHTTKDGLTMAADIALCRAKHVSRNSVAAYDPSIAGTDNIDPQDLYQVLRDPNAAAVRSLAAAVDARDPYTCGHSERVAGYAVQIGDSIGVTTDMADALRIAGMLHDLGKIGIPDPILSKRGSLTNDERDSIRKHPALGGNILRRTPQLDLVLPAVLFHHERWDGAGYPNGLKGEEIPLIARIMGVADAFDAMTSERPYRRAMSVDDSLSELRAGAGKQFDPELVEVFISAVTSRAKDQAA